MAFVVLNSDIRIGSFRFSGVNRVNIKRSLHSYADSAVIKIPRQAMVQKGKLLNNGAIALLPGSSRELMLGKTIVADTPVSIKLGYNGEMKTEFEGFVKTRSLTMPLELVCEGYIRQLRKHVCMSGHIKNTTAKEFLEMACGIRDVKGTLLPKPLTDVTVVCQDDIPMCNIMLIGANGQQMVDEVKKISLGTLSVFFIEPKVLWCGFTYTPYKQQNDPFGNGLVGYRLGWNCIKDNGLREKVVDEPVQVILGGTYATGQVVQTKSEAGYAIKKDKTTFNNVQDLGWMTKMANEKQYRMNYAGYEGHITGFLQPFCLPGYKAMVVDNQYPERNGHYMVESTEVSFGVGGARRVVELGPLVGFNPDQYLVK